MTLKTTELELVGVDRRVFGRPSDFLRDEFGINLWSKQSDILAALRTERRVAVRSCNCSGKTFAAACAVVWWLMSFQEHAIAITTAPTERQVKELLWRVIRGIHRSHAGKIGGTLTHTGLDITPNRYARGFSTDAPERFQGFHSPNILFVVDEASGVHEDIYEAIEGSMTNPGARLLLIGNPNNRHGTFFDAFHSKRSLWHRMHISAFDSPNFRHAEALGRAGFQTRPHPPIAETTHALRVPLRQAQDIAQDGVGAPSAEGALEGRAVASRAATTRGNAEAPGRVGFEIADPAGAERIGTRPHPPIAETAHALRVPQDGAGSAPAPDGTGEGDSAAFPSPSGRGGCPPAGAGEGETEDGPVNQDRPTGQEDGIGAQAGEGITHPISPSLPGRDRDSSPLIPAEHPTPISGIVSPQWVEEAEKNWGRNSPAYQIRVLGEFPTQAVDTLIPLDHIERCVVPSHGAPPEVPPYAVSWDRAAPDITIGVDVARYGSDSSAICVRNGIRVVELTSHRREDTMQTAGRLVDAMRRHRPRRVHVDEIGVGAGVVDRLREQGLRVRGVNVSERSSNPRRYANLRAEIYDSLRQMFERGLALIPEDQELIEQLAAIRYSFTSTGQLQIESKESMSSRGLRSPDKADAMALAAGYRRRINPRRTGENGEPMLDCD